MFRTNENERIPRPLATTMMIAVASACTSIAVSLLPLSGVVYRFANSSIRDENVALEISKDAFALLAALLGR